MSEIDEARERERFEHWYATPGNLPESDDDEDSDIALARAAWIARGREAAEEHKRLRAFRDAVLLFIVENAGGDDSFAYIWQSEWDKIKAALTAGGKDA